MTNKELAKELLGYTYIDIQNIPETYKILNIDINKFKKEYEQEDYESALSILQHIQQFYSICGQDVGGIDTQFYKSYML